MFEIARSFYNPQQDHGFWSPSTSASNFCEEDYQTSYYVAEFINTISNLAYIYYALRPPTVAVKPPGHTTSTSSKQWDLATNRSIWDLHTPALIAVGLSSALFHGTLHSLPQWFDESSMYLLAASFIHSLLTTTYLRATTTKSEPNSKSLPYTHITRQNQRPIALCLVLVLSATSYISFATGNLTIHSVTFGLLLAVSGLKLIYLIFTFETPAQIRAAPKTRLLGFTVTETQRTLLVALLRSWAFLELAFALWLVDCNPGWCNWLRYVRNEVLWWPLGYVTELHGWWHFFTARAAGEYIVLVRVLTTAK